MRFLIMPLLVKLVLVVTALAAAYYDLRVRRIPNWVSLSGVVLGLGLNAYFAGLPGAISSAGGLLAALAIYVPLYALRGMGAGDVKLMAAIGAIVGPGNWLHIFIATALIGGAASLILVLARRRGAKTLANISVILSHLAHGRSPASADEALTIRGDKALKMPHGAVIAAGVCLFLVLNWTA